MQLIGQGAAWIDNISAIFAEVPGRGLSAGTSVLRTMALLQLAKGVSAPRIAGFISLTPQAIRKVGHLYVEGGLERALYDEERPGAGSGSRPEEGSSLRHSRPPEISDFRSR
jgi:hypothetical protein